MTGDRDRSTWLPADTRDPRPPATDADAAREAAWQVARWGAIALAVLMLIGGVLLVTVLVVALGAGAYFAIGMRGGDFIVRNDSGVTLHNVALIADRSWSDRRRWTIGEVAEIAPGDTVDVAYSNNQTFRLRVEFNSPAGRHAFDDVDYIDGDESGDRDVVIDSWLRVNGREPE